jgi:signal transduction histidine kinase
VKVSRLRPRDASDVALAALLLLASAYDLLTGGLGGVYPHGTWPHVPFLVATAAPVAYRRTSPLLALGALAVAETAWTLTLYPLDVQPPLIPFVQALIVVYSAGAFTDGRSARAAIAVVGVAFLTDLPQLLAGKPLGLVAGPDLMLLVAFLLGQAFARVRRERARHRARAAELEIERDAAAARAAAAERARIARELHDVVSHDVSLMVLQASVERRANPADASAPVLATIESTGREALGELRRMLGVLRHGDDRAPLEPQPGLASVPLLVEQTVASGVDVVLHMDEPPADVPPGVGITAYRIVQEALTNSAKHAPGAPVTIDIRSRDGAIEVEVRNGPGGHPAGLPSGGHGLIGMRERAALCGGTVHAAPADGGFLVRAVLPLPVGSA